MKNTSATIDPNIYQYIASKCIITGAFNSRSGVSSPKHFDKYILQSEPGIINKIADLMLKSIPSDAEVIACIESGSIPIATLISGKTNKPLSIIRKKRNEHGTLKLIEGASIREKKIVLIDDVIDSGKTLISALNSIMIFDPVILKVSSIIYRGADISALQKSLQTDIVYLYDMDEFTSV